MANVTKETKVFGDRSFSSSFITSCHVVEQINFNVTILFAFTYPVAGPQLV